MANLNLNRVLGGTAAVRICVSCGAKFTQYGGDVPAKHCPTCADLRQKRPTIVRQREKLAELGPIRVLSLPAAWTEFRAEEGDEAIYKIDIRGREWGARWGGRIVMYSPQPVEAGDIVVLRHMRVVHDVRVVRGSRPTVYYQFGQNIRAPIRDKVAWFDDVAGAVHEKDTYEYVFLQPASAASTPSASLVWAAARTKTTLKGFGRQYRVTISGQPLWAKSIFGGTRSGRAFTVGVLAVVDRDHPLVVKSVGNRDDLNWVLTYAGDSGTVEARQRT